MLKTEVFVWLNPIRRGWGAYCDCVRFFCLLWSIKDLEKVKFLGNS